jgi:hypothetical protein
MTGACVFNNLKFTKDLFQGQAHLASVITVIFEILSKYAIFFLDAILIKSGDKEQADYSAKSSKTRTDEEGPRIPTRRIWTAKIIDDL